MKFKMHVKNIYIVGSKPTSVTNILGFYWYNIMHLFSPGFKSPS